jgi:hypothetical protein
MANKVKLTRKAYVQYLNENGPMQGSKGWIIGGKIRMGDMWKNTYGNAQRKYNKVGFEVGYNEWVKNNS